MVRRTCALPSARIVGEGAVGLACEQEFLDFHPGSVSDKLRTLDQFLNLSVLHSLPLLKEDISATSFL